MRDARCFICGEPPRYLYGRPLPTCRKCNEFACESRPDTHRELPTLCNGERVCGACYDLDGCPEADKECVECCGTLDCSIAGPTEHGRCRKCAACVAGGVA